MTKERQEIIDLLEELKSLKEKMYTLEQEIEVRLKKEGLI